MSNEQEKVIESPPNKVYIYKIFDHCGCSVTACVSGDYINDVNYTYICGICFLAMTPERYRFILNYFQDDMKYKAKDLLNKKEWINEKIWVSAMIRCGHDNKTNHMNGTKLYELYCSGMNS